MGERSLDEVNGSQAPRTEEARPKAGSRRTLYVVALAVVIVAAVSGYWLMSRPGPASAAWVPKAGDYLVWVASGGGFEMTIRVEVKSVSAEGMSINTTIASNMMGRQSMVTTVPLNSTMGLSVNVKNPKTGVSVKTVGVESVSTKWGSVSATHYTVVDTATPGLTITQDYWIAGSIPLKMVQVATGVTTTMTLTDTNIRAITG